MTSAVTFFILYTYTLLVIGCYISISKTLFLSSASIAAEFFVFQVVKTYFTPQINFFTIRQFFLQNNICNSRSYVLYAHYFINRALRASCAFAFVIYGILSDFKPF